jgi:iron complex outermembrane receptor protein
MASGSKSLAEQTCSGGQAKPARTKIIKTPGEIMKITQKIATSLLLTTSIVTGCSSLLLMPQAASAQAAAAGSVQEVVVTARRREEVLQKVPVAVTAFNGEQLKQQSVRTVTDLQGQVPGLFLQEGRDDPQSLVVTLRGRKQDDITLAVDPAVSLNVDGLYIPRTLGMAGALLDIKRVEILRGPQGTLYGRNSTGGAIGLNTNDPTDKLEGSVDVTGGNYGAWDVVGIANVPIVPDSLAARFVAERGAHDGYSHNSSGTPLANADTQYYRAKLRWNGPDDLQAVLSGHYESTHTTTGRVYLSGLTPENFQGNGLPEGGVATLEIQAQNPNLTIPQAVALLQSYVAGKNSFAFNNAGGPEPFYNLDRWDVTLNITGNLTKDVQFHSITGYQDLTRRSRYGAQGAFTFVDAGQRTNDGYVSQEFQLLGSTPTFNWVTGIYFGDENGEDNSSFVIFPLINGLRLTNNNGIHNSSIAGFAQATWEFIPTWRLTAGGRYTSDYRRIDATALFDTTCVVPAPGFVTVPFPQTTPPSPTLCPRTFQNRFSKPTWLVSIDHQITPDILVYAKVATGYRSGGENESGAQDIESFAPFAPETDLEYEAGVKSEFFNKRLRLNLDGYRDEYSNLQVQSGIASRGTFITAEHNAATAVINGMEAEADVAITSDLSVHASTAFTDAHYVKFPDAIFGDRSHEPFPTPKWTASLSGRYVASTDFGRVLTEVDYSWKSTVNFYGLAALASQVTQTGYGLLNARLTVRVDAWDTDFALFGKNITDVKYSDQATSEESFGFNLKYLGAPATFGVEVIKKF